MKKIAIILPGIGYRHDRPLLYYTAKLAVQYGYTVVNIHYEGFPEGLKGDPEKMQEALDIAYTQAVPQIDALHPGPEDEILMISKSIGTYVAGRYQLEHSLHARNLYLTPVAESTAWFPERSGIAVHGTGDDWTDGKAVERGCREKEIPLYTVEKADHSMETGDVLSDIGYLREIIAYCDAYLQESK